MWGTATQSGTGNACGTSVLITGYVEMVEGTNADLTATTACALTSSAKVQFFFSSLNSGGTAWTTANVKTGTGTDVLFEVVVLNGVEEWKCGGTAATFATNTACATSAGVNPNYWGVGGATSGNSISFGLATYSVHVILCDAIGTGV